MHGPRQRPGVQHLHVEAHVELVSQRRAKAFGEGLVIGIGAFDAQQHPLEEPGFGVLHLVGDDQRVFVGGARMGPHHVFHGRREEIDAAHDQHVIGAALNTANKAGMGAAIGSHAAVAHHDVTGPPSHQRTGLLVEMGEHQDTRGSVGHRLVGVRVEDFHVDEIFCQGRPELQRGVPADRLAFERAVTVEHLGPPLGLDPLARSGDGGPRLAADTDHVDTAGPKVHAAGIGRLGDVGHERGRTDHAARAVF